MTPCHRLVATVVVTIAAMVVAPVAHADVITVGSDAACDATDIQAAIDAARQRGGAHEIRLARGPDGGAWTAQALSLVDVPLTIVGGHATCGDTTSTGITIVSGAGGTAAPVITGRTTRDTSIALRHVALVDGDAPGDLGGGIDFRGVGALVLDDVRLERGAGGRGGGVHVEATRGAVSLHLARDVVIVGNVARTEGGGVFARGASVDATVTVTVGDDVKIGRNDVLDPIGGAGGGIHVRDHAVLVMTGRRNAVHHNTARAGGGIAVRAPAQATIAASPVDPSLGTIFDNHATYGGGVMVSTVAGTGDDALLRVYAADAGAPFVIAHNRAIGSGGALYIAGDLAHAGIVAVCARHVAWFGNEAPHGAALHAQGAGVRINDPTCAMPADAPPTCAAATCDVIADHVAPHGESAPGATIALDAGAYARIVGTSMRGNVGTAVVATSGATPTRVVLRDALLHDNVASKAVIDLAAPTLDARNEIARVTIVANEDAGRVVHVGRDAVLDLRDTLVDQPGVLVAFDPAAPLAPVVRDVMDAAPGPLPPDATVRDATPVFDADAATPYTQATSSPGVDALPPIGGVDRYGSARDVDVPTIDHGGIRDIGAIETPLPARPVILRDGFEDAAAVRATSHRR